MNLVTRHLCLFLGLFLFVQMPSAFGQADGALLQRAKDAIERNDLDAALRDLNLLIGRQPDNAEAYTQRARVFILQGNAERALTDAEKALSYNPRNPVALNVRGLAKGAKDDYAGAIADFSAAIALDARSVKAYINRGVAYRFQKQPGPALADFGKALEIEPANHAALWQRAELYRALNKCEAAVNDYNALIKPDAKDDAPYAGRAYCLAAIGKDLEAAGADSEKALGLNPKNVTALTVRGFYKSSRKDYDGALADLSLALSLRPRDELANRIFEQVVRAHPNPAALPSVRQRLEAYQKEAEASNQNFEAYKKLADYFRTVSPKTDDSLSLERRRAINFAEQKKQRDYYLSLAAQDERNVCAYYFAAMTYPNALDGKELFDKAIDNFDGQNGRRCSVEAAFWLGRSYAEAAPGRPSDDRAALRYYNRVLELDPQNPDVKNWIAKLVITKSNDGGDESFMAGVRQKQARNAEINRLHLAYLNRIAAGEKRYNQYGEERGNQLDYTPQRFAQLTELMKKEANSIIDTANEALAKIGGELSAEQKQFYQRKIAAGRAALIKLEGK